MKKGMTILQYNHLSKRAMYMYALPSLSFTIFMMFQKGISPRLAIVGFGLFICPKFTQKRKFGVYLCIYKAISLE